MVNESTNKSTVETTTYVQTDELRNIESIVGLIKALEPNEQQRLKDMLLGMQFAKNIDAPDFSEKKS